MEGNLHFVELFQTALSNASELFKVKQLIPPLATVVAVENRSNAHYWEAPFRDTLSNVPSQSLDTLDSDLYPCF